MLLLAAVLAAPPDLPDEAQALVKRLTDPDPEKRLVAIQKLGHLARRGDRTVDLRCDWRDLYEPKVSGLVPHLIRADAAEDVCNGPATIAPPCGKVRFTHLPIEEPT
jgi:hypothetical protein